MSEEKDKDKWDGKNFPFIRFDMKVKAELLKRGGKSLLKHWDGSYSSAGLEQFITDIFNLDPGQEYDDSSIVLVARELPSPLGGVCALVLSRTVRPEQRPERYKAKDKALQDSSNARACSCERSANVGSSSRYDERKVWPEDRMPTTS